MLDEDLRSTSTVLFIYQNRKSSAQKQLNITVTFGIPKAS